MVKKNNSLAQVEKSIQEMFDRLSINPAIKTALASEHEQLQQLLAKVKQQVIHIVVYGRVSVGKSSLLNALIGAHVFSTSVLHGETKHAKSHLWQRHNQHNITYIDTPGIDEIDAQSRAQIAFETLNTADIILFVIDADMTQAEFEAAIDVLALMRPVLFVLNKADRYNEHDLQRLRVHIIDRLNQGLKQTDSQTVINAEMLVAVQSIATEEVVYRETSPGQYVEESVKRPQSIGVLQEKILSMLEADAHQLTSLSANLFLCELNQKHIDAIAKNEHENAQRLIQQHCIYKSVSVALNPMPVLDMAAAASVDVLMVVQLSKLYGVSMTHRQAHKLIMSIASQMAILYGSFWLVHAASSALKLGSFGLTTMVTGLSQGAIAWYSTRVIGEIAKTYIKNGHSWGEYGSKLTIESILSNIDKNSVMIQAKDTIKDYIK